MVLRTTTVAFLAFGLLQAQKDPTVTTGATPNPAAAAPKAPPFATCPSGSLLGGVELRVKAGEQSLPFHNINHLSEGDTLLYSPILRGKEKRPGDVALVLVPAIREPGKPDIEVTDPKGADKPQEWKINRTISLVGVVYGPAGLNKKKVAKFLSRDEVLVAQLADYADKTAQAEQLVTALSNSESSSAVVNAALNGFASQYGFAVQIDRNAPIQSQAATVFAAMNPQLAAYNPLVSSAPQTVGQTASLATMAGSLFFGSPVGLAAGGTAMLLDLRSIAFPDTQFRASFVQTLDGAALNMCGQTAPAPPHTRVAYIWASRIPNIPPPAIHMGDANYVPAVQKTPVPATVPDPGWKFIARAREWTLLGSDQKKIPVPVAVIGNQKSLELDLSKSDVPPGDYQLSAYWDWQSFTAGGNIHVEPLSKFDKAHLDPASQDRLLAKSGATRVRVEGGDFQFVTKVEVEKRNDEFATPSVVRFLLPKGLRKGPQDHMDVLVDTQHLDPGDYQLLLAQQDGTPHPVNFKILPNPPKIDNLPILVNPSASTQHYVLKGERLDQLSKLVASGAELSLSPPTGNPAERSLTVELKSTPKPGTELPVKAYVENRSEPLNFPDAIQVTGPTPTIASSKLSLPEGLAIAMRGNEFPAGYTLNAVLDVKNIERQSLLRLECADGVGEHATLHIGEQRAQSNLQQLSPDQLFVAFDTSPLPADCSLQAVIDNGRDGASQPFTLARILRMPQIDSLKVPNAVPPPASTPPSPETTPAPVATPAPQPSNHTYQITGQNLEMIEQLGWSSTGEAKVTQLPVPLPGPGMKQSLQVTLPDPLTPAAVLYVWLRGDQKGRATTMTPPNGVLPPVPAAPPPGQPDTGAPPPQK